MTEISVVGSGVKGMPKHEQQHLLDKEKYIPWHALTIPWRSLLEMPCMCDKSIKNTVS